MRPVLLALVFVLGCSTAEVRSDVHAAAAQARLAVQAAQAEPAAVGDAFSALSILAGTTGPMHDAVVAAQQALAAGDLERAHALLAAVEAAAAPK